MSDTYKVIYSPEALDDIRKIYSYIAFELQVPDTALNQLNRIRKEVRSFDFMPMRYSLVDWEP
jgi:plasmid stabilization system protein ParE